MVFNLVIIIKTVPSKIFFTFEFISYMRSDQLSNMNTPEYSPPTPEVLSPDMFGAVCLFITEVSKQHRKRLRARRQCHLQVSSR